MINADLDYDKIYEIRLRVGRPLFYTYDGGEGFLTDEDGKYVVTREDLKETMEYVSGYALSGDTGGSEGDTGICQWLFSVRL